MRTGVTPGRRRRCTVVEWGSAVLKVAGEVSADPPVQGSGAGASPQLIPRTFQPVEECGEICAQGYAVFQGDQRARRGPSSASHRVCLARGCRNRHGVSVRDHRLQEGVAIDLVGIPKVDETDGCRPHRRAVPGRPDPSLIPRLPEIFVVVDEPPDRSPNSPDVLSRKPLCQVVWIDQPISEFFQFLTISDLWPLTSRCPLSSDL